MTQIRLVTKCFKYTWLKISTEVICEESNVFGCDMIGNFFFAFKQFCNRVIYTHSVEQPLLSLNSLELFALLAWIGAEWMKSRWIVNLLQLRTSYEEAYSDGDKTLLLNVWKWLFMGNMWIPDTRRKWADCPTVHYNRSLNSPSHNQKDI